MTNYPYQPEFQQPPQQFQPQQLPPQQFPPPGKATDGFGIAALVIGIVACLVAWVPLCGIAALPLAGIGLILAIVGVILSVTNKRTTMSMSIAGGIVCLLAFGIQIAVMAWLSSNVDRVGKQVQAEIEKAEAEMKAAHEAAAAREADAATRPIAIGEHVQIQTDDVVYGTTDLTTLTKVLQLQDQEKQNEIEKLVSAGKAIAFKDGDAFNVVAVVGKSYKVSPLSDDKAGKTFYVPTDAVRRTE